MYINTLTDRQAVERVKLDPLLLIFNIPWLGYIYGSTTTAAETGSDCDRMMEDEG